MEGAQTLEQAAKICAEWYPSAMEDQTPEIKAVLADHRLDSSSVDALNASIAAWENRIAEAYGKKDFSGHGNYFVSARDAMGLDLVVKEAHE